MLSHASFASNLEMVRDLLADTRLMQQQLSEQSAEQVLGASMLQRWLARTERVRQLQEWLVHQPLATLPLDQRLQLEEVIADLCRAMIPIGPMLQRHQGSVIDALTSVAHRRQQLNRYHQGPQHDAADWLVTDRA